MAKVGRSILAVIAGVAVWGLLWNLGTQGAQAAFPEILQPDRPITHIPMLLGYIAYSVVLSMLAGLVTAAAGEKEPMPTVWALAVIQLALGIVAEVSYWSLLPVWYHLVFLALVVPATVFGGRLWVRLHAVPVRAAA